MPSRTIPYAQPATTKTRSLRQQREHYLQQSEMAGSSSFYHDPSSLGSSYQNGPLYLLSGQYASTSTQYDPTFLRGPAEPRRDSFCRDGTYITDDQSAEDRASQELPGGASYTAEEGSQHTSTQEPVPIQLAAPFSPCSEPPQHIWRQLDDVTPSRLLARHIHEACYNGAFSYFCKWNGCKHPVGFTQRSQALTHIRSTHLREKPFVCLTCNTRFGRKQEAKRHAITMNNGKQYRCNICCKAFSRKHYRDSHEERCLFDALSSGRGQAGSSPR